jgi:5-formyltetrahydrofolate cyclo-ligase
MYQKNILREKYFNLRKKKYHEIDKEFFSPLLSLIKSNFKKDDFKLALYYPSSFEVNVLKILENKYIINKNTLLPKIEEDNTMEFFPWKKNQVLLVNKYGILEPRKTKFKIPNLLLVPILAFDANKHRLGYGKGFYDRYLNKYSKKFNNILTVGVAFSFQKHHKLPTDKNDVKLDYILTEKGIC